MGRLDHVLNKIKSLDDVKFLTRSWQLRSDKVVFTNGCFDILHQGHVTYLAKAAEAGSRLIIGLNTDSSVRRQGKGEERPINAESSRAQVLASLGFVDAIVLFDDDTPLELIKAIQPDVLVKGADYDAAEVDESKKTYIVGANEIKALGGRVEAIPLVEGFSTTNIVNKLKQ